MTLQFLVAQAIQIPSDLLFVTQAEKLAVRETPFFVNKFYDVNRPDFIDRLSALDLNEVYGPMVSSSDAVAAVVKVVEERHADRAGFPAEEKIKRDDVLGVKVFELRRNLIPHAILKFAGYKDLVPKEAGPAPEPE